MKSSVINVMSYQAISVPKEKLTIKIPSWDAVAQPLLDQAQRQYEEMVNEPVDELTDAMVVTLQLPDINSIQELKRYGMDLYERNQKQLKFYNDVLPFILQYYAKNANVVLNSEEKDAYISEYLEQVQAYADQENMTLEEYGREKLKLDGDINAKLNERAEEDFIFKLIAQQAFDQKGGQLDEAAYEEFIQQNVLHNNADEIELRDRFSYDAFKNMMPEMALSQEIYDYFLPQIHFEIDPKATLSF